MKFDAAALLTDAQRNRAPRWLLDGYTASFEAIAPSDPLTDDDPPSPMGLHWESANYLTAPGDPLVRAWIGGEWTPEQARREAFELLAHADIAEAQAAE